VTFRIARAPVTFRIAPRAAAATASAPATSREAARAVIGARSAAEDSTARARAKAAIAARRACDRDPHPVVDSPAAVRGQGAAAGAAVVAVEDDGDETSALSDSVRRLERRGRGYQG